MHAATGVESHETLFACSRVINPVMLSAVACAKTPSGCLADFKLALAVSFGSEYDANEQYPE
jgi:hypothetical protein